MTLEMISRVSSALELIDPCKRVNSNVYSIFASVMFVRCLLVKHDDESRLMALI